MDGRTPEYGVLTVEDSEVDFFVTVNSGKKMAKTIHESKAKIGVESLNTVPEGYLPKFVDYPFTKEQASFEDHFETVRKYSPKMAVTPDIEHEENINKRLRQAEKLKEFADYVIVITKVEKLNPSSISEDYVVGVPNQEDFGSNRVHDIEDFERSGKVHILGGSPSTYSKFSNCQVFSCDSASILKGASFGDTWTAEKWVNKPELSYYERVAKSIENIWCFWND